MKLTHNLGVKFAAILLLLLCAVMTFFCGLGYILMMDSGWSRDGIDFYDTDSCRYWCIQQGYEVARVIQDWEKEDSLNFLEDFQYEGCYLESLSEKMADGTLQPLISPAADPAGDQGVVGSELVENEAGVGLERSVDEGEGLDLEDFQKLEDLHPGIGGRFLLEFNNCTMILCLADPILSEDSAYLDGYSLYNHYRLFQFAYPQRHAFLPLTAVFLFISLLLLSFLFAAAGHRRGETKVLPNRQDRIPLDLYIVVLIFLEVLLLETFFSLQYANLPLELGLFLATLLLLMALGLAFAFLLTCATRLKLGKWWWRNSLIYIILRGIFHLIRSGWRTLCSAWASMPGSLWLLLSFFGTLLLEGFLLILASGAAGFFLLIFLLLNIYLFVRLCRTGKDLQTLKEAGQRMAAGDVEYQISTEKMLKPLALHGKNLNAISLGISVAVEQRMKSERLKTELITNVSHDIKTPLTSIVNYVDLLQKNPSPEQQAEYLSVLDRQARRLKKLTEDLVEASKASTGNIQANLQPSNVNEMLNQVAAEYAERFQAGRLEPSLSLPEQPLHILADGRLLWRVLDNLLNNVVKYALAGTRVYIQAYAQNGEAVIAVKNISREALNVSADELMERFVRGDSSRNTEGSGLGLNIARSLSDLQGGKLSLFIDGDLFKAELRFPLLPM